MPDTCHALRCQDEMHCPRCRLRWDVNDPERPECAPRTASGVPAIKAPPLVPAATPARPYVPAARCGNEALPAKREPFASGLPFVRK